MTGILILPIVTILITFYFIKLYQSFNINENIIESAVYEYYDNGEVADIEIHELNTTEKLKYNIPVLSIFYIYHINSYIISGEKEVYRKVYITYLNDEESTKYVTLTIKNNQVITCKEFDSFDI